MCSSDLVGGLTINSDVQRLMLASGKFVSGSGTGITVNTSTFCGHINGDDFKDPGECDSTGDVALLSSSFGLPGGITVVEGDDFDADGTKDVVDSDYNEGFRFIKLRDSSSREYSIYMDKFNFGSGSETFVMVEYEKAASLSAMTNGQFFKIADAGSGQPLDFDVRFVKSDKANWLTLCHRLSFHLQMEQQYKLMESTLFQGLETTLLLIILQSPVYGILKMLNRSQELLMLAMMECTIMIFQLAQVKTIRSC